MDFSFYIYGTPNDFCLYPDDNAKYFFQTLYAGNGGSMNLAIHRMASGQVSYSYLRYNFISGSGRTGSFFGMSVIFDKAYCVDIENLYALFDEVYKTILQNKILLEEMKGSSAVQAKYRVRNFADADSEVKRIENIVRKNIKNTFSGDIHPITELPPVPPNNAGLTVKLNDQKGNAAFLKALREYSQISISPEYKDNEKNILSSEAIARLDETIEEVQKTVPNISIGIVKGMNVIGDIETVLKQIKDSEGTIKLYLQIQPELKERNDKLLAIQKQLSDLHDVALDKIGTPVDRSENPEEQKPPGNEDAIGEPGVPAPPPIPESKRSDGQISFLIQFSKKHKTNITAVAAAVFIVACGVFVFTPDKPPTKTIQTTNTIVDSTEKLVNEGDSLLQNNKFDDAIEKFQRAKRPDLVEKAKTEAARYWIIQYERADTPKKQKECLVKANKYPEEAKSINPYIDILIADIEIIPEKRGVSGGHKSDETCYVQIPGYKLKKTVDDFLKAIEYDLNRTKGINSETLKMLRNYCDLVINDRVGCLVSQAQKKKAAALKEREPAKIKAVQPR